MLGELVTVENPPQMSGRFLSMILVPNREAVEALRRQEQEREKEEAEAAKAEEAAGETMPAGEADA
jgi:hypothetical protein